MSYIFDMYDVVVVGGNLAGTTAAISATEKGAKVALIEKYNVPHYPPHCGEGMDNITASFINFNQIHCKRNTINELIINLAKKEYAIRFKNNVIITFDRYHLEKELLKKTKQQGTDLFLGNLVKSYNPPHKIILEDSTKIEGKIIIDASGINCVIGKIIGLKPKIKPLDIGVCIQSRVKTNINPKKMKAWFHKPYADYGYGWIFPIDKNHANIGLGIPGGQHIDMKKHLKDYIQHEIHSDYEILNSFYSCVPSAEPLNKIVKDNVLITGDAARLANSFLGSGIANAIFSGCLAGCISTDFIKKKINNLELYQEVLRPKINRLTKVYQKRNKIFSDKNFINAYARTFSILSFGNKLFPNFFHKKIKNALGEDVDIIKKYKKTSTLF